MMIEIIEEKINLEKNISIYNKEDEFIFSMIYFLSENNDDNEYNSLGFFQYRF